MGQGVDDEVFGYDESEIPVNHPGGEAQEAVEKSQLNIPSHILCPPLPHHAFPLCWNHT